MQPETPTPMQPPVHSNKKLFIALGICAGVIVAAIIAMVIIFNTPINQTTKKPADETPANVLTVGKYPYIYACSAMTREDIAKVGELTNDKTDESISADHQAIPYDKITDKKYDLIKTLIDPYGLKYITADCDFTKRTADSRQRVALTIRQYSDKSEAELSFNGRKKSGEDSLSYDSFKKTSYILPESRKLDPNDPDRVQSYILVNNSILELSYEMGNATPENAGSKLDSFVKTIVERIKNNKTTSPHDFTGAGIIGKNKLTDACKAVDVTKVSELLGKVDYERAKMTGDYTYGTYSLDGTTIRSQCDLNFRYQEDVEKQPDYSSNKRISSKESGTIYPNNLTTEVITYESPSAAEAALAKEKQDMPRKTLITPLDFTYGSASLGYKLESTYLDMKSTSTVYKAAKGSSVIVFTLMQNQVEQPYISTVKELQSSTIKAIFDSIKTN